jgi:pyruvate formate lyase activating enzyme
MYDALEIAGREVTVEDILQEVEKDRVFYDQSGGGVTLSGGEPLHQPEFLRELLEALRKSKIPVALDTTGHAPFEVLASIVPLADVVLYDLKLMDDEKHKKHTRVSNALILENLKKLARKRKDVIIRIPLIAGVNDDDENTRSTIDFLAPLAIRRVSVLPYHKGGVEKYKRLRKEAAFKTFAAPSEERIQEIMDRLLSAGFQVQRGG